MTREEKEKLIRHLKYNLEIGADYLITDKDVVEIIKALEQEPCADVVSRQAVLDIVKDMRGLARADVLADAIKRIEKLPPVRPQEQTGHWIYTEYHTWCCSECGGNPHKGTGFVPNKDGMKMRWKYCNLCGARMVEPQESEEKNEKDMSILN